MPKEKKETTEVVKFDVETQVIVALDTKYKNVQITDGKSYALVMAAIGEYRDLRLTVVEGHKKAKAKILEDGNWLDSEKRRILARLAPGEDKLKTIRQAWDDQKERIKKEKAEKEEARKDDIRAKITQIAIMQSDLQTMGVIALKGLSDRLENMEISDDFMEFKDEAEKAIDTSYDAVQDAIAIRIKLDEEAEERKAEAEHLKAQRKEQEATQAKREQLDIAFEDRKEWFKKHIKGDSFQTPNVDELEKAIPVLEAITNHEVHEPAIHLLLDEQVEEAHGILKFRKDQAKIAEAQKKIDEANKKIREDKAKIEEDKKADQDRKTKFRTDALFSIGLKWDGEQYCFMDLNVYWTDIATLSDNDFDDLLGDLRSKIMTRKEEEAERIAKEATEKAEATAAQKVLDMVREADEKKEAEAEEKERKEALKPDKEKLIKWIATFNTTNNPSPQLKSKKAQEILRIALEQIEMLLQDVEAKIEKL